MPVAVSIPKYFLFSVFRFFHEINNNNYLIGIFFLCNAVDNLQYLACIVTSPLRPQDPLIFSLSGNMLHILADMKFSELQRFSI